MLILCALGCAFVFVSLCVGANMPARMYVLQCLRYCMCSVCICACVYARVCLHACASAVCTICILWVFECLSVCACYFLYQNNVT